MIRTWIDEDLHDILSNYAIKNKLMTRTGIPSINRALKHLLFNGSIKIK